MLEEVSRLLGLDGVAVSEVRECGYDLDLAVELVAAAARLPRGRRRPI